MTLMGWKEKVFRNFRLYAVTDLKEVCADFLRKIEQAYQGGADIVQLRSKTLSDIALIRLGLKVRKLADRYKKLFFINDRIDLAFATGADGVHLGQTDMPISVAQRLIKQSGRKFWIGKSTHTVRQAIAAEKEKVDYIGIGPVYPTPTKPFANVVGLKLVAQACKRIRIPWVAIGGIDLNNIHEVLEVGATRVAVVRAIFAAENSKKAAQQIKQNLKDPTCPNPRI